MTTPALIMKSLITAISLFFISTFCAHLLLSSMEGDSVDLLVGQGRYSREAIAELKANRGLYDGFSGVFTSYFYGLHKTISGIKTSVFSQTQNDEPDIADQALAYSIPTFIITGFSLIAYLLFTILFSLSRFLPVWSRWGFRVLFVLFTLFSLLPVFGAGAFFHHWINSQFDRPADWVELLRSGGIGAAGFVIGLALIQGLTDGAFIEGVRGFREETDKIRMQPHILFQRLNGGRVNRHIFRGIMPYLLGISYYRFIQILGSTIVLEYIFNIKGLGYFTKISIAQRNSSLLFSITIITMAAVGVIGIFHRVVLNYFDPRRGIR